MRDLLTTARAATLILAGILAQVLPTDCVATRLEAVGENLQNLVLIRTGRRWSESVIPIIWPR